MQSWRHSSSMVFSSGFLRWAALALWCTTALTLPAEKHDKSPRADGALSAPALADRVPVDPIGYQPSNSFYLIGRYSSSSLDFIDRDHLLFTFRVSGLLKRLPDCPPEDEDQLIRAVVIELPSEKIVKSAEWRMHDRGRYLWRLRGGRFLVRQRDALMLTDQSLELRPYLESHTPIDLIELSPDAGLLLVENDVEQHTEEEHKRLVAEAKQAGASPPREAVQLTMVRTEDKTVIARSQTRNPINLPVVDDGYLETLPGKKDHWIIRYVPFHGDPVIIADVPSACQPNESLLNSDTAFVITCAEGSDHLAHATSMAGKRLWDYRWEGRYIWPTLASSQDGSRVAFSTLRVNHPVSAFDPIDDTDISAQRVEVFDVASGNMRLVEFATPVQSAGQNYALSPDGRRFAVLRDHAIEVYDLPPAEIAPPNPASK